MKFIPWIITAAIIIAVIMFGIFMYKMVGTDMGLVIETQAESLRITHNGGTLLPKEDLVIKYNEVTRVELLDALPTMRKTNGLDNIMVRIGAFESAAIGDFRAYVKVKEPPHLVIYTAEKTYLVTPEDAESVFEAIQANISGR